MYIYACVRGPAPPTTTNTYAQQFARFSPILLFLFFFSLLTVAEFHQISNFVFNLFSCVILFTDNGLAVMYVYLYLPTSETYFFLFVCAHLFYVILGSRPRREWAHKMHKSPALPKKKCSNSIKHGFARGELVKIA